MASAVDDGKSTLSPDDAFAVLGNETRMEILQTLGQADGPLAFSELHERVGVRDSGQFNYHLGKLTGHFLRETEAGYELRRAGSRVIESVLSGAVTETPVIESSPIVEPCHLCGGTVEVIFMEERLETYCTECAGLYGEANRSGEWIGESGFGYLGYLPLPPAGVQGRTPDEVLQAAWVWGNLEFMSFASGVCPRCSATVDYNFLVCKNHDASEGLCSDCDRRKVVNIQVSCTNCIYGEGGEFTLGILAKTEMLKLFTSHGLNPINPESPSEINRVHSNFEEEVLTTEPFKARFTYSLENDAVTFTVDEELNVVDVTKSTTSKTA